MSRDSLQGGREVGHHKPLLFARRKSLEGLDHRGIRNGLIGQKPDGPTTKNRGLTRQLRPQKLAAHRIELVERPQAA